MIRFDGFIAAYTDQKEDDAEDEENRRLPEIRAGETLGNATRSMPTQHYDRAAAALFRSDADQEDGRARHRPALDLHGDPEDARGPRICDHRQAPAGAAGQGPAAVGLPRKLLRSAMSNTTSPPRWRRSSTRSPTASSPGRTCCAISGRDFSGAVDDIKELRVTDVLDALNEELAPLVFPAREDGSNPRICPKCGTGNLSLKLGKFGAFVGCSNYPECSYTRQLGDAANGNGEAARPTTAPRCSARIPIRSEEITLRSGRFGPYVQRGDGKEAKRSSLPKGWTRREHRPRKGAGAAVAAARRRPASRKRQDDLGRHRPLRAVRAA